MEVSKVVLSVLILEILSIVSLFANAVFQEYDPISGFRIFCLIMSIITFILLSIMRKCNNKCHDYITVKFFTFTILLLLVFGIVEFFYFTSKSLNAFFLIDSIIQVLLFVVICFIGCATPEEESYVYVVRQQVFTVKIER
jgi:FtsH-binding integral membrane protein